MEWGREEMRKVCIIWTWLWYVKDFFSAAGCLLARSLVPRFLFLAKCVDWGCLEGVEWCASWDV